MKYLLTILLILIPIITCSQSNDYSPVDNYVNSLKVEKDISIPDLTKKLTLPFNSDLLKVRAIFFWIASNIEYVSAEDNSVSRKDYPYDKEILLSTYNSRKGTCYGYSHLFKYMLGLSGIKSNIIPGYVRTDIKNFLPKNPNHAWNSVKIDDRWYLFDVTWARDSIKKVNNFWFKTDPEVFILNHYPVYQPYTLTEKQYSLEDFGHFPIYTNLFYGLNFTGDLSKTGHFIAVNDTVAVHIKPNFECELLTKLYYVQDKEWIPRQKGEPVTGAGYFKIHVPKKGDFVLKLGALKKDNNSYLIYDELVYYTIENK